MTVVWLLHDEGPGVGLGHRARMTALAQALAERGADAVVSPELGRADVLVVDSYQRRADALPQVARAVAAVDDLGRDLAVDLLVDPNPPPNAGSAAAGRALCGVRFALVKPPTLPLPPVVAEIRSILVTSGAADRAGVGAGLARALAAQAPDLEVVLVVGPWGSAQVPPGVREVRAADGLEDHLRAADLVVTAAGVTMLEACQLGRPVVAVTTVENQARAASGAAAAGAVVSATIEAVPQVVRDLVADVPRCQALARAARSYVDGRGPTRVAEAVLELV